MDLEPRGAEFETLQLGGTNSRRFDLHIFMASPRIFRHLFCKAHVRQLHVSPAVHQEVLTLHISVDKPHPVEVVHCNGSASHTKRRVDLRAVGEEAVASLYAVELP